MKKTIFSLALFFASITAIFAQSLPSEAEMQRIILNYMNEYRAQHHRPPLTLVPVISAQARRHSLEMASHAMPFGHQGFNNRIAILYKKISNCRGGAENIAYSKQNVREVSRLWTESRGHRANILGNYNLTGIGIVRVQGNWVYYTQMFIKSDAPKFLNFK